MSELTSITVVLPDWPWWGWLIAALGLAMALGFGQGFFRPLADDLYRRVTGGPRRWL